MARNLHGNPTVLAAFIGGGATIIAALVGTWGYNAASERDLLRERISLWRFSEPLYREIPGNIDFLTRQLRADKREGSRVKFYGPAGDEYTILISSLRLAGKTAAGDQQYVVNLDVSGVSGSSLVQSNPRPFVVKHHALVGPINAGNYEFFLFFDRIDIDYVYLTVARRPAANISFHASIVPFGAVHVEGVPLAPILLDAPMAD